MLRLRICLITQPVKRFGGNGRVPPIAAALRLGQFRPMESGLAVRIIEQIDAGALDPRAHNVCRSLARHLCGLSSTSDEVVRAFDEGRSVGNENLSKALWADIERLPLGQQGGRRIVSALGGSRTSADATFCG